MSISVGKYGKQFEGYTMAGLPPPESAKRGETMLMRYIRQFHEKFVDRLTRDSNETLRSVAWQLDEYRERNKQYKDTEFLKGVQDMIEFAIQKKSNSKWTVEKAKTSLKGRTRGVNQFAPEKIEKLPDELKPKRTNLRRPPRPIEEKPERPMPITRELARELANKTAKPAPSQKQSPTRSADASGDAK